MIPTLDYYRPKNVNETLELLSSLQGDTRILAGGTDILPGFHQQSARFKDIKTVIDIHHLEELSGIAEENGYYTIGAAASFSAIANHAGLKPVFPALTRAASSVGSLQIRNRATIGGNFINNAPCADTVPPLLIYDAVITIRSLKETRDMALEQFLEKPYSTQLKPDELVTAIKLPVPARTAGSDFYKLGRRRGVAISRISLALLMDIRNDVIHDMRIASGAVTPIGKRFKALEQMAEHKTPDEKLFKQLARGMGEEILKITGMRWSTPYKLPVVQQTFYQLLEQVAGS